MDADVSVIIPAYDAARFLARAVASVRRQTVNPREVIVVDDGSTDGTAEVAAGLGEDLVVLRQANAGPGAARNRGARAATGAAICFLDADDEYEPVMIEQLAAALADFPEAAVASGAYLQERGGLLAQSPPPGAILGGARAGIVGDFFSKAARYGPIVNTNTVMVRRSAFHALGGFREDKRFGEDVDLWDRLAGRYAWAFVDVPVSVYHNDPATSVTLRTRDADKPTDVLLDEQQMARWIRPALWPSYRRYRRDWLCARARGAIQRGAPARARRLLTRIAPAPASAAWGVTWLLSRLPDPLGESVLRTVNAARGRT